MNNNWSIITPVESTNKVKNPSAEITGNYGSLGGAVVTRSTSYQKYGLYSYRVQTSLDGDGIYLTIYDLGTSASNNFVTARIRGKLPTNILFSIGGETKTPQLIEKIDDNWKLYGTAINLPTCVPGWSVISTDPTNRVYSIIQTTSGKILASDDAIIWASTDDGATWFSTSNDPTDLVYTLLQTATGRILASELTQIWKSDDDGVNWVVASTDPDDIYSIMQTTSGKILAGGFTKIWKSEDDGDTWGDASVAQSDAVLDIVQISSGTILAADGAKVWVSIDDGVNWSEASSPPTTSYCFLEIPGAILAGGNGDIWTSVDGGDTWNILTSDPNGVVRSLLLSSDGAIYAGDESGTIFVSLNNGVSWSTSTPGLANVGCLLELTNGNILASDFDLEEIWSYVSCVTRAQLDITQNGSGSGNFYIDGIQVESLPYWTTYIDGTQDGCSWNGTPHASTSTRSGQSLAGGKVKDFYDDFGFLVEKIIGGGSTNISLNIDEYAFLPGGEMNTIKANPREITIIGKFIADTEYELHDKQQALLLALSTDNYPNNQPMKIRYNGARVLKELNVYYKSGLEGEISAFYCKHELVEDDKWAELLKWTAKASISFISTDPYWYEIGESAAELDTNDSATFRTIAARLKETGQWDELGPPDIAGTYNWVNSITEDDTYMYIGGDFLNFNNIANGDYIIKYNKETEMFSSLSTGADNTVFSLILLPDGRLVVGGNFHNIGGIAATHLAIYDPITDSFSKLGDPDNLIYCSCVLYDGRLVIGGLFHNIGLTPATHLAVYNPTTNSFSALGNPDKSVYCVANTLDNLLVIGGEFDNVGGIAADNLAILDLSSNTWSSMGDPNNVVRSISISQDNMVIVAGNFTSIGGISVSYIAKYNFSFWDNMNGGLSGDTFYVASAPDGSVYASGQFVSNTKKYNGYSWSNLDIDLPGDPITYSIFISKKGVDKVIQQKYNIWLGFGTTGIGYFGGKTTITNEGNTLAYPKIVFGRSGGTTTIVETLKNETTGKELLLNYSLLDGEELTVDLTPTEKSITSDFFGSRFDAILANCDFGSWCLQPGTNIVTSFVSAQVALYPSSVTAYMLWRNKYLSYN